MSTDVVADPPVVTGEGGGPEQCWPLPTDEQSLLHLIELCFGEHWRGCFFGIMVPGAAWEVAAPNAPERISLSNGYVTVDFGPWHFHLCIGEFTSDDPESARTRRCSRAELYRRIGKDDRPTSWGVRLFNGNGQQMMTLLCPNPFLTDDQKVRAGEPDWTRLELWDRLREHYLGLGSDPLDRQGKGFRQG
ncbi:hypothetical protein KIH27_10045 [Mycobacterium sp. M1]|uniref:Uncharacterized protein n=1 Tax=Mycolicibacter acidiphilus TaxID=2835306 RepID=A0ABS5RHZ5_9MYCO|nr:hypothetical protein [Mycolicibacter acidiphilus]MBS9533925.1 hypothetical protein [Mycolicibacter acidiphilus]